MRARYIAAALGIAALAAARPASAQRAFDHTPYAAAARPVATYLVVGDAGRGKLPVRVEVGDSSGTLVARYWLDGQAEAKPMVIAVDGTDILLGADTPKGALQVTLYRQNERGVTGRADGRWSLGAQQGTLRGRSTGA